MIRQAAVSDAASIAHIIVEAWQTAYSGIIDESFPSSLSVEKYTSIFTGIIRESSQTVFVFEQKGEVVGFVSGVTPARGFDCEVKGLYVYPSFHGEGIGSELLGHIRDYFISSGCSNMIIWTLLGVKNNRFYALQGGVDQARKTIEIGGKKYSGVGYSFNLKNA